MRTLVKTAIACGMLVSLSSVVDAAVYYSQHLVTLDDPLSLQTKEPCTRWFDRWGVKTCVGWGIQRRTKVVRYEFQVIGPSNIREAIRDTALRAARNCALAAIPVGHAAGMAATGATAGAGAGAYPGAFWAAASATFWGCVQTYGLPSGLLDVRIDESRDWRDWR